MRSLKYWVLVLLLVFGCTGGSGDQYAEALLREPGQSAVQVTNADTSDGAPKANSNSVTASRRVIYDADIDLSVNEFSVFAKQLPGLVQDCGGYVSNVTINQRRTRRTGTWQVRVQAEKFDDFVVRLNEIGFSENHHQTTEDVTDQFVDLNARIVNKKRMESRILDLLDDSKRNLQDLIGLEKELARIRGEVERMAGRMKYLKNRTEFATLTITATEFRKPLAIFVDPTFSERIAQSWSASLDLLVRWSQNVAVAFVYLFPWLTVLIVIAVPILVYAHWRFRRLERMTRLQNS